MTLKVAICDNDPNTLHLLTEILWKFQIATDHNLIIDNYPNGQQLLNSYLKPGCYHILFLDVEMPIRNGIDTAKEIRKLHDKMVIIVFISNHLEYIQDSLSVHPFDYLQKPLLENKIIRIMNRIT
ncbi:MAG: response regulator, partial [Eubacteriales bacterium]|nr:response regulator [Eubacteriales bacterium]